MLYIAAAVARLERWRFNYGRKITPSRIANFHLPSNESIVARVNQYVANAGEVKRIVLEDAEDNADAVVAAARLAELEAGRGPWEARNWDFRRFHKFVKCIVAEPSKLLAPCLAFSTSR